MKTIRNLVFLAMLGVVFGSTGAVQASQENCSECDPICNPSHECNVCGNCDYCTAFCTYWSFGVQSCMETENILRCGPLPNYEVDCLCY